MFKRIAAATALVALAGCARHDGYVAPEEPVVDPTPEPDPVPEMPPMPTAGEVFSEWTWYDLQLEAPYPELLVPDWIQIGAFAGSFGEAILEAADVDREFWMPQIFLSYDRTAPDWGWVAHTFPEGYSQMVLDTEGWWPLCRFENSQTPRRDRGSVCFKWVLDEDANMWMPRLEWRVGNDGTGGLIGTLIPQGGN